MTNDDFSILMKNASYFERSTHYDPTFIELDLRLVGAESNIERESIMKERLSLLHDRIDNVVANLRYLEDALTA